MRERDEIKARLDKHQDLLTDLMEKKGLSKEEASTKAFMEVRKVSIRFRCMECGSLIPKNSRRCRKCGSYDVEPD